MSYKHGVYGVIVPSQSSFPPLGVGTLPVYVGTAPINTLTNTAERVNKAYIASSFDEAKAAVGYSDDWNNFSLCEAIFAHFSNPIKNIGPIALINVLDPATDKKTGTASVTFVNKVGYIDSDKLILSSIDIGSYVLGVDFSAEYVEKDGRYQVKITDKTAGGITSPAAVDFDQIDITKVTAAEIVGGLNSTTGKRTGLGLVDIIYQESGYIPTILAAPGWSHIPEVYTGLVAKCQDINGHWDAVCCVDIDSSDAKTVSDAEEWKELNGYTSKYAKVCWPMTKYQGIKFHTSTIAATIMQQTDFNNNNIPFESPSNKQAPATGTICSDDTLVSFDEAQAVLLNSVGITTIAYLGGVWRLYGPHMGNYTYASEDSIKPEDMFDSSIRMMHYIKNSFQKNYVSAVDGPFSRRKIESILGEAQVWINGLVSIGAILYGKITFENQNNPSGQLAKGNFVFDVATTTTPPGKSITFRLQYSSVGLDTLVQA